MPEGPSIIIAKEAMKPFEGKVVKMAGGNAKAIDLKRLEYKKLMSIKSWGKHLLLCFSGFTVRVHFLMFGSYAIDEEKKGRKPKLRLVFGKGSINFYAGAIKVIEGNIDEVYDWTADVMNAHFDKKQVLRKLKEIPGDIVSDALLDQDIFSGVGNIIKNEVLFRIKVHPETLVGDLPLKKRREMIDEAVNYSFDFLDWKIEHTLSKHWLIYTKKKCPRDKSNVVKEYLGKTKRRTFYCPVCQKMYE